MNATELFLSDGKSAKIWLCSKCGLSHSDQGFIDRCCKCDMCGCETTNRQVRCSGCYEITFKTAERKRFEKAAKVQPHEYSGWIYAEGYGREYFDSVTDLLEHIADEPETSAPEYVWTCEENQFVQVDVGSIAERFSDDAWEDFSIDDLNGVAELRNALEAFVEANKSVVAFHPDYSKAVLIPQHKASL